MKNTSIHDVDVYINNGAVVAIRDKKVIIYERAMIGHTIVIIDLEERVVEVADSCKVKKLETDPFHP